MGQNVDRALVWIAGRGPLVYFAVLLIIGGTWGFIALSDEVGEGGTQRFDNRVNAYFFHHRGPRWLQDAGRDITAFGGVTGLSLIVAVVSGYLLITRRHAAMILTLVATIGGLLLTTSLKHVIDRPRPPLQPPGLIVYTTSFPSGHSMLSAVVYLTLGSLLARVTPGRAIKIYLLGVALFMTLLVGLSRVYLCAHYPTDVLAGWSAGLVWAILCGIVARELQRRGSIERDVDDGQQLTSADR